MLTSLRKALRASAGARLLTILTAILAILLLVLAVRQLMPAAPAPRVQTAAPVTTPAPEPEPEPELVPLPVPGDTIRLDDAPLATVVLDDIAYVSAQSLADVLSLAYSEADSVAALGDVRLTAGDCSPTVGGELQLMNRAPFVYKNIFYIPLDDITRLLGYEAVPDEASGQLCYTTGTIPEGRSVPVLMYHAVSNDIWGMADLFVDPAELERQLIYLAENGYDPIWFDDLTSLSRYDKPVILTFDDGYDDNYTELLPLLRKYNVKATVFVIANAFGMAHKMTQEQVRALSDSGLVSIGSHGMTHHEMGAMGEDELREELSESKRILTEVTGVEPTVLCYPSGSYSDRSTAIVPEYYSFALKMNGGLFTTGDDPMLVSRYFVSRYTTLDSFAQMADGTKE